MNPLPTLPGPSGASESPHTHPAPAKPAPQAHPPIQEPCQADTDPAPSPTPPPVCDSPLSDAPASSPAPHSALPVPSSDSPFPPPFSLENNPHRTELIRLAKELASKLGRRPLTEQLAKYGISRTNCIRYFGSYANLLSLAGFACTPRRYKGPHKLDDLYADYGRVFRELGRPPLRREYEERGSIAADNIVKRCRTWHNVHGSYENWAKHNPSSITSAASPSGAPPAPSPAPLFAEPHAPMRDDSNLRVHPSASLPPASDLPLYDKLAEQPICGRPLNYLSMLHEPTNEQGVVLLFGMMAPKLGFLIDNVRTGFPDCDAKRRVGPNEFQRIRIEFEYLSSRFNHPEEGCDLVVCWKHDTDKLKVEVLELAKLIAA